MPFRFSICCAWYGCGVNTGLNVEYLERCLWEVMLGLEFRGFKVHALVSDGLSVNRALQRKLVQDAKAAGFPE